MARTYLFAPLSHQKWRKGACFRHFVSGQPPPDRFLGADTGAFDTLAPAFDTPFDTLAGAESGNITRWATGAGAFDTPFDTFDTATGAFDTPFATPAGAFDTPVLAASECREVLGSVGALASALARASGEFARGVSDDPNDGSGEPATGKTTAPPTRATGQTTVPATAANAPATAVPPTP